MLSKNKIKLIQSLDRKKNRDALNLFLAEGNKMVEEAIRSKLEVETIVCTDSFLSQHPEAGERAAEVIVTDADTIRKASLLQNPQESIAIVKKPAAQAIKTDKSKLIIALDFIQDPGNLGTILRIADWFGIESIVCSENTVDIYNPKVVQASMGAIFRTNVLYCDLEAFISKNIEAEIPVYGTFLEGANIYQEKLSSNGILVMGNEGNGISEPIAKLISRKISIPSFATGAGSESLNVAIAAAICCSEFKRR